MKKIIALIFILLFYNWCFSQRNNLDSIKFLLQSKLNDTVKIDKINVFIGSYAQNDPVASIMFADSAINLALKLKDSVRLAHSYSRKGVAYYYLGDYNSSLDNYFKSINIKESINQKETTWRELNNIGLILRNLEQNEEALRYFQMALNLIKENQINSQISNVWNNIGISYRGLKQYDKAENALILALKLNTESGNKQLIAHNLNNLGNVYSNQKNYARAILFFKKALEINKILKNNYEQVQNMNNLSSAYIKTGNFDGAKSLLIETENILTKLKADVIKFEHLKIYADYYKKTNDYKNALIINDLYIKFKDSVDNSLRFKQFDQLKLLANAEKEIQKARFLQQINTVQNEKIRAQKIILFGGSILFSLILFLLFITLNSLKAKRKLNQTLIERNDEIESLNNELVLTNEELHTQRDNLEQIVIDLKNTQEQLIQSEKMASLGIMAAGVAHEINNPLNFIQGGLLGIEQYFNEKLPEHMPEMTPLINGIQEGITRASAIVTSLNHYSRQDKNVNSNCNIHEIMDNCLLILQNQIKDRIEIRKRYTSQKYTVYANEGKLHQAFLNLLSNSVQAIPLNGLISITTFIEGNSFMLSIEDSGTGILPENLSKVFTPFFTTKPPGKGTGLGLAITYNIINEHNGKIFLESESGKFTRVNLVLPLKPNFNL